MPKEAVPGMKEAVEARRLERRLSPGEFAAAAGLTEQGLTPVRRGARKAYQDKVRRGVAVALGWPLDWYDRLLAGEDAATFPDTEHPAPPRSHEQRLTDLEKDLVTVKAQLAELLLRLTPPQGKR